MNADLERIENILTELTDKVEKLGKKVNAEGEEIKEESKIVEKLNSGVRDLTKYLEGAKDRVGEIKDQCESKIVENPLAYILGAFVGGVILGNLMGRTKSK